MKCLLRHELVQGVVGELPMLGQRVVLALRVEEVRSTPLSIDGEFGEAVSECEDLKMSFSHLCSHQSVLEVETGARAVGTTKAVGRR